MFGDKRKYRCRRLTSVFADIGGLKFAVPHKTAPRGDVVGYDHRSWPGSCGKTTGNLANRLSFNYRVPAGEAT